MIKTPKISDVGTSVVNGLTITAGAFAGRGIASLVPEKHATLGKAGVAVGSLAVATALKGNGRGVNIAKLALTGVAAMNLIDIASEQIKKHVSPTNIAFVDKALGLGCGCSNNNNGLGYVWPGLLQPHNDTGIEAIEYATVEEQEVATLPGLF